MNGLAIGLVIVAVLAIVFLAWLLSGPASTTCGCVLCNQRRKRPASS